MSDVIERLKKRIEARKWKITDDASVPELIGMQYANNMNDWCLEIIDEESAKEPQECNLDLISRAKLIDNLGLTYGSSPLIALTSKMVLDTINNQPQVQPIVRSADEIAEAFTKYTLKGCKEDWIEWLTKKEV